MDNDDRVLLALERIEGRIGFTNYLLAALIFFLVFMPAIEPYLRAFGTMLGWRE
ncbi:hypothetical protein [Mesorhizobium sp.]|uniref:hypothetical protein n=1 Tax=Mesorhizobium sp. TaxID=1871066 RepID=UPI0025F96BB8|nr:hypothetical protein [Mesorhizobium sp.]